MARDVGDLGTADRLPDVIRISIAPGEHVTAAMRLDHLVGLVLGKVETRAGDRDNMFRFNGFDPLAAQVGRDRRSQHEPDVTQRREQTPWQVVAGPDGTDDDAIPTSIEPGEQQSVETLGRVENRRRIALDTAAQCTQV